MKISNKLILVIAALGLIAGPASSLEARSRKNRTDKKESSQRRNNNDGRGGRAAGALGGAATGGIIAGVAGSGKWAPLGIVGGGIAGYFLVRSIQKGRKNRRNREDRTHKNKEMKTERNR